MALAAAVATTACDRTPEPAGQVVAVVNGEEITASELETYAQASRADLSNPVVRRNLLQGAIDRHLLVAHARQQGLDQDPVYLAQRRASDQALLSQLALRSAAGSAVTASEKEARAFIINNPAMFADRSELSVEQVRFAPASRVSAHEIAAVESIADAESVVKNKGIRFEWSLGSANSGNLDPAMADALSKVEVGRTFYMTIGEVGTFAMLRAKRGTPISEPDQIAQAQAVMRNQRMSEASRNVLLELRRAAKIQYQKGYAPTPKGKAAPGKAVPNKASNS